MATLTEFRTTIAGWGLGWFIAFVVLILCIICWFLGRPLTSNEVLGFLALLALARLT